MDKNIERIIQSPMMKLANENQARLDSLSLANGSTDKLLKIAQDLDLAKNWAGRIATQDLLSQFSQDFPQNNLAIDKSIVGIVKNLVESNSIDKSLFESIKLNTALIDAFESTRLGLKPTTQFILPKGFTSKNQIGDLSSIISKATEAFKQYGQFGELESFKAISKLNDVQFEEVISTNLTQEDITNFSNKPISEIGSDLSDEIESGKDFSLYSDEDKKYLSYIYHSYLLPFMFLIMGILIAPHVQQAQAELEVLTTQKEVNAFTRSSSVTFDRQALKGHRFTTISLLNLRDKPNMHSNVIESLPIGTIARVINKSDRSWLLVEVEINSELEQGWILRRYTTYFK